MKHLILLLAIFNFAANAEIPERLQGTVEDLYCGGLDLYDADFTGWQQSDEQDKPISGRCVFFVKKSNDTLVGILTGSNPYTGHVPSGESHSIVLGRSMDFWSCKEVKDEHKELMLEGDIPMGMQYMNCYYAKMLPPKGVSLDKDKLAGTWTNRRQNHADVLVEETSAGDLFTPPTYEIEVIYNKGEDYSEVYFSFDSDEMSFYNNADRPYFQIDIQQDCDDPDCYNTDGTVKIYLNQSGSYTLHLDFNHYNNAPMEYGDEWDFEDTVYLRKK